MNDVKHCEKRLLVVVEKFILIGIELNKVVDFHRADPAIQSITWFRPCVTSNGRVTS